MLNAQKIRIHTNVTYSMILYISFCI